MHINRPALMPGLDAPDIERESASDPFLSPVAIYEWADLVLESGHFPYSFSDYIESSCQVSSICSVPDTLEDLMRRSRAECLNST